MHCTSEITWNMHAPQASRDAQGVGIAIRHEQLYAAFGFLGLSSGFLFLTGPAPLPPTSLTHDLGLPKLASMQALALCTASPVFAARWRKTITKCMRHLVLRRCIARGTTRRCATPARGSSGEGGESRKGRTAGGCSF